VIKFAQAIKNNPPCYKLNQWKSPNVYVEEVIQAAVGQSQENKS